MVPSTGVMPSPGMFARMPSPGLPENGSFHLGSPDGITFTQATLSLITCIIGAGIMALPMLPKRGGCVFSVIIMVVCCYVIACSGCDGLCKAFAEYNKGKPEDQKMQAYDELGRRALGRPGEALVTTTMVVYFMGVLAGYVILIAEQLEGMSSKQISVQTWKCVLYLPFCGLACLRDMTTIAKLVPIAIAAAIARCFVIIGKSMLDTPVWYSWETDEHGFLLGQNNTSLDATLFQTWPVSGMALGSVTGLSFGAYGVNGNVPSVLCEMRDPSQMPRALRTSLAFCLSLYLCIMLVGHYGYGNFVQDNLLDSMSRSPANAEEAFTKPWCWWTGPCGWQAALMMQVLVLANMIISFPLNLMAVIQSFQNLDGVREYVPVGSVANYGMRITMVTIIFAISFTIDKFGLVFGLFASVCGPAIQTLFPIVFGYMIEKSLGGSVRLTPGKILSLMVACFCMVVGFLDSMSEIKNNWSTVDACLSVGGSCAADGSQFSPVLK
eukprot:TRINITY_DN4205_c1_g2_i1.p1 TRINITY_DN4205_c1_g2~~TRINITY_DN4205_c1_g2_i1.p1  ORF type:complete len:538 (-),score=65.72 TRINITY_DN4205_c1_g2_i1:309-1793(-)